MKDAYGGVFNLTLLFTFILLVSGFALFGVDYYRAFTIKNKLLSLIESYEGNMSNTNLQQKAEGAIKGMGYYISPSKLASINTSLSSDWTCLDSGWCYKPSKVKDCYYTYEVKTFVSTDIPLINQILVNSKLFEVNGYTKPIKRRVGACQ